jgi:hypothetical protein
VVLGDNNGIPKMEDPTQRYQDQLMERYLQQRDAQPDHEEIYQGSPTHMIRVAGDLTTCNPRKRARRVKLMLDLGVHGRKLKLMDPNNNSNYPLLIVPDLPNHILYHCKHEVMELRR